VKEDLSMTTTVADYGMSPEAIEPAPTAWSELMRRPVAVVSLSVVMVYLLLGLLAFTPFLSHRAKTVLPPLPATATQEAVAEYAPPSLQDFPARLLGTDIQNRSVFYRTLFGARTALTIALLTSILTLGIGVVLGVTAGYFGSWVDDLILWLVATVSAVPWILLVLALGFVLKGFDLNFGGMLGREPDGRPTFVAVPDLMVVILAMGLTDWVGVCRLIRGEVLKQRSLDYVAAAKAMGFSQARVVFRHVLPNTLHLVIITFTLGAVGYVQAEVALTFLGVGISDAPSWGRMIDDAKLELLRGVWWQFAAASVSIGVLSLALSLLGDALRDVLDPRTRTRR
jgi:peptide/nickel transport system permease protein